MLKKIIVLFGVWVLFSASAMAALTPEEIKELDGPKLTAIGAEKAGNADGTIPPYTGEKIPVPAGFDRSKQVFPLPKFVVEEKPLYVIDSKNMAQHADKLSEMLKALLTKYPGFHLNVYPTHRTYYINAKLAENTKKLAAVASLENDGKTLNNHGITGGISFPIPKNGLEMIWNHIIGWHATQCNWRKYRAYIITSAGKTIMTTEARNFQKYPFWGATSTKPGLIFTMLDDVYAPANRNGEKLVWENNLDKTHPDSAWQYLPGQRRVKMAPEVSFDGPNTTQAGAATYDDNRIFTGSPERYDWKIVGKKEMIVPYNSYYLEHADADKVLTPQHPDPEAFRFELHRVWVLEANLKKGMRHLYPKRVMYVDEDSWTGIMIDNYDANGKLWRGMFSAHIFLPDLEAGGASWSYFGWDFTSGIYYANGWRVGPNLDAQPQPDDTYHPQAMAGSGIR